jgi:hypothetical protein
VITTTYALTPILAQEEVATYNAFEAIAFILLGLLLFSWVGRGMATKEDRDWFPGLMMWGFIAKMLGSLARFYMVTGIYRDGDSFTYHSIGRIMANVWRGFVVPTSNSSAGTATAEQITGFLYAPYSPSMLGGFLIFALVAFTGQLLFYAAGRHWLKGHQLRMYAVAVFFFPSLIFWPSSIGKDALMLFFLGLAAYGASRMLRYYQFSALLYAAPGLYFASLIRSHVAAVMGLAIALAALFGRAPKEYRASPKRAFVIVVVLAGAAFALSTFSATFGVSVDGGGETQDPEAFLADVSERTATGGSEVEGGAVGSPAQLPGAVIKVLYRPLIYEARSFQQLASAMEGTILLVITVWKLPTMWRRKRLLREKPMLLLAFFYTGGFIIGFSAILNLGILARQRIQVLPLFFLLLVGLGWDETRPRKGPTRRRLEDTEVQPATPELESAGAGRHETEPEPDAIPQ